MSQITDLSSELLIKVFRYLDPVNLKKATLTCKLWNNLIESACLWSFKWADDKHHTREDTMQKLQFITTTNRKFGEIFVETDGCSEDNAQIPDIIKTHGSNVVKLTYIDRSNYGTVTTLTELLNLTPNLQHAVINLENVPGDGGGVPLDPVWAELKKLRRLDICVIDERIIKCFTKAELASIRLLSCGLWRDDCPLAEFLTTQPMLTSLTVYHSERAAVLYDVGKLNVPIPFRLTKLVIINGLSSSHERYDETENLLRFVQSQAAHWEELQLGFDIPSSVYECIFSMPKLNTLSVMGDHMPRDSEFYKKFKENCSVRTLKLKECESEDLQFVDNFLKKLPNIRSLIFLESANYLNEDILVMAQNNLSKLESLSIDSVDAVSVGCVKFPNLKELQVERLGVKVNWNEFTQMHSRLIEFTIEEMDDESYLTSDDIDHITTNIDLQSIRLGAGFVADDRFFEIIRVKCANLKVLDLHKSCVSDELQQNTEMNVLRVCDVVKRSNIDSFECW